MRCRAKPTGVVCRPEHTVSHSTKMVIAPGRPWETARLQDCRRESRSRGKSKSHSGEKLLRKKEALDQEPGSCVGEYCFAQRNRGCIQTKDVVGRHRRRAIESSVARPGETVRTPARELNETGWEHDESRGKNQPHLIDHKAASATEYRDDSRSPGW